jgi:hypothetical protein
MVHKAARVISADPTDPLQAEARAYLDAHPYKPKPGTWMPLRPVKVTDGDFDKWRLRHPR